MRFTLYYDGPLHSAGHKGLPREKQAIREALYPQFLTLWHTHPALPDGPKGEKNGSWTNWPKWQWSAGLSHPWWEHKSVFPVKCASGDEIKFVPLVRCDDKKEPYHSLSMLCELSVLFLRPGPPGKVFQSGDIDNRLLTLSDALCVPKKDQLQKVPVHHKVNDPFFCLLEDDTLISRWSIRTAQLLALPPSTDDSYVRLIIDVLIKVTRVTEANIGFIGE
jgi:hypothetical protein